MHEAVGLPFLFVPGHGLGGGGAAPRRPPAPPPPLPGLVAVADGHTIFGQYIYKAGCDVMADTQTIF